MSETDIPSPTFFDEEPSEQSNLTYIVIGIVLIGLLYFYFSSSGFPINEKDPIKAIEITHKTCPVMGGKTALSTCLQYPPLNKGFIVSVCCEQCISKLQSSFNKGDGEYTIKEENGMNILYHNSTPKQVTPLCSQQNMGLITDLVKTQNLGN